MSRPLRSTTTPASSGFPATTGRSASERRDRYSMPTVFCRGTLPLATLGAYDPGRRFDARLLTFRTRAADQDHAAYTPGTAWPTLGPPPSSSRRACNDLRFRCHLRNFRRLTSARPTPRALLERLPDPHLTGSSPAFSLIAHHDGLQPTQHRVVWRLPPKADAGGPAILHLSHSSAYGRDLLHDSSLSVRDALQGFSGDTCRAIGFLGPRRVHIFSTLGPQPIATDVTRAGKCVHLLRPHRVRLRSKRTSKTQQRIAGSFWLRGAIATSAFPGASTRRCASRANCWSSSGGSSNEPRPAGVAGPTKARTSSAASAPAARCVREELPV